MKKTEGRLAGYPFLLLSTVGVVFNKILYTGLFLFSILFICTMEGLF
jgi:hypothetical protein